MTKRTKITAIEQAAIDAHIATKGVTVVEKKVRAKVARIESGDSNFDLYCNALPKPLRQWAAKTKQDVRGLYKEYRTLKAAGMIEKYGEAAAKA